MGARDEVIKGIDELPVEMKTEFEQEFTSIEGAREFAKMFADHPILGLVSPESLVPMIRDLLGVFWKSIETDVEAFCNHWKNLVPPEETVSTWNEGEFDAFQDAFEEDLELLFKEILRKWQEKLNSRPHQKEQ